MNQSIRSLLLQSGVVPKKSRGQNFLVDVACVRDVIEFSEVSADDIVLEIGPGLGAITSDLLSTGCDYYCVDIQKEFCEVIKNRFPSLNESRVICQDILKFDLATIHPVGKKVVVVSNVPYSISSQVIQWIVANKEHISRASLLLQKEFAQRVSARPCSKAYGSLTVHVSLWCETALGRIISGDAFYPVADVESRLLRLIPRQAPLCDILDEAIFERLVRDAFSGRRKTIANTLSKSVFFESKTDATQFLLANNIEQSRRAETLSVEEYAKLANAIVTTHAVSIG